MSRSRRYTPIAGNTTARSDKPAKRRASRALRRAVHVALQLGAAIIPTAREIADPWTFPKDGKRYFGRDLSAALRK